MITRLEVQASFNRNHLERIAPEPLLCEDRFWAGLAFDILSPEELAHHQAAGGMRICSHRGVWWRQVNPWFCRTSFPFSAIDHRQSWPSALRSLVGYMHVAAPASPSNGTYPLIIHEDIAGYSISRLGAGERSKVRRGLSRLDVRVVDRLDQLLTDGREVYRSWQQRVGWYQRPRFDGWISWAFEQPKRLMLGAYKQDKLVAFMVPYATGNTLVMAFAASHSEFFKFYPNDVLFHALLCIARQTTGLERVIFSGVAANPAQNKFKLGYGSIQHVPTYTWLNPLARPLWQLWVRGRPWLTTLHVRSGGLRGL